MEEIVVYTTLTKAWPLFVASMHFRKASFPLEKCGRIPMSSWFSSLLFRFGSKTHLGQLFVDNR